MVTKTMVEMTKCYFECTKKSYSTNNTYSIISYDEYVGISSTSKQFTSTSNYISYYVHQTTPPTIYIEYTEVL